MSKLFILRPTNEKERTDAFESVERIVNQAKVKLLQFGVTWAYNGQLFKRIINTAGSFPLASILSTDCHRSESIIIYCSEQKSEKNLIQPYILGGVVGFVSCGDMVLDNNKEKSPAQVFLESYLYPSFKHSPSMFMGESFRKIIEMVARKHVAHCFFNNDGTIHLGHDSMFETIAPNCLHADFLTNRNNHSKSYRTSGRGNWLGLSLF